MRIVIDPKSCNGCERCIETCFEVFSQWGLYLRPVFEVKEPDRHREAVARAVLGCPRQAIRWEE
ncbi:MAG: ferredoxin [Syntrophaceae bacterium]|nr:ferredoxin [Syntrophaceae bacterium]